MEQDETEPCDYCGGSGWLPHDCWDDTCCCLEPYDDCCHVCDGTGLVARAGQVKGEDKP